MKIAIVEDNIEYGKLIYNNLFDLMQGQEIDIYIDGESYLKASINYDYLVLDIELPGKDGIDISKEIQVSDTKIIFLTSSQSRVYDAFGVNVIGYLLKKDEIKENVTKLLDLIQKDQKPKTMLDFRTPFGITNIDINTIIKVQKERRKLYIHTIKESIQVYDNALEKIYMNSNGNLIYVNKSTLINIDQMVSFNNKEIILKFNHKDFISRNYLSTFKKEYLKRVTK